jgi:hypothetical protein
MKLPLLKKTREKPRQKKQPNLKEKRRQRVRPSLKLNLRPRILQIKKKLPLSLKGLRRLLNLPPIRLQKEKLSQRSQLLRNSL